VKSGSLKEQRISSGVRCEVLTVCVCKADQMRKQDARLAQMLGGGVFLPECRYVGGGLAALMLLLRDLPVFLYSVVPVTARCRMGACGSVRFVKPLCSGRRYLQVRRWCASSRRGGSFVCAAGEKRRCTEVDWVACGCSSRSSLRHVRFGWLGRWADCARRCHSAVELPRLYCRPWRLLLSMC
jgi:hypothetical protein